MKRLQPSEKLAAIIGDQPMSPAQAVEELWGYIRENGLQDAKNPRRIKADANLERIFGGQDQVTLLELARLIGKHLSAGSEGEAIPEEELGREFEEKVLASAYETLGCSPGISDEDLKQKFRELCQENRPDRLAGEEVPAAIIKLVEEKFQEIRAAYEVVVTSRS